MMRTNGNQERARVENSAGRKGFGLIECLIAAMLLMIGLVSMMSLFTLAVASIQTSRDEMIARQKAREMLESIYTARNTQQITFDMIKNSASGGIFLDGFQPLRTAGVDGLLGTSDDGDIEQLRLPGEDEVLETDDDQLLTLDQYERQAAITAISEKLREVTVTVRYRTLQGLQRNYRLTSYISAFR